MEEEFELSDYYHMLRRNWILAIIIFFVVFGAVTVYTFTAPEIYEARTLVRVTNQDQTAYLLGSSTRIDIETQKAIILSSSVVNAAYGHGQDFKINVDSIKDSDVIEIRIEATSRESAKAIANTVADSYADYTKETRIQDALEVSDFISEQLAAYKTELDKLNTELLGYEDERATSDQQLEDLNAIILDYKSQRDDCDTELDMLKGQLLDYEENGTSVSVEYLDLTRSIADKGKECDDLSYKYLNYLSKKEELRNLTSTAHELRYKGLIQNIAAKEKIYDYLLSRKEEVAIAAQERSGNVKIIEYANMPLAPIKPNIPLNLAIGFILAAVGSTGIVFLRQNLKNTFKGKKDINAELGQVIGAIPKLKQKRKNLFNNYTVLEHQPDSKAAESIRLLRTNVMLDFKDKKLLSITSARRGEGKSLTASNLALGLAKAGKTVLLVDSNLRNPVLNSVFHISRNTPGLSDVILDDTKLGKVIKVKQTSYKNLYLLPAGKIRNTTELLSSDKMKDVCKKLRDSDFDVVIFDNSSLEYSEAATISANCDGVLFVIAQDRTNKEQAIDAKAVLTKFRADIIGIVVNGK